MNMRKLIPAMLLAAVGQVHAGTPAPVAWFVWAVADDGNQNKLTRLGFSERQHCETVASFYQVEADQQMIRLTGDPAPVHYRCLRTIICTAPTLSIPTVFGIGLGTVGK
jgi:hypothetical protein